MTNIFITGVPNAGKTTLFNGLTGKNERVGNWYGVTTKAAKAPFSVKINGKKEYFTAVDLPGSYFDDYTLEQNVAKKSISGGGVLIVVCQATNLRRGLEFLKKTLDFGLPVILVLNFYDELKKQGGRIDVEKLKNMTGVDVIIAECNKKSGVNAVKERVAELVKSAGLETVNAKKRFNKPVYKDFDPQNVADMVLSGEKNAKLARTDRVLLNPFVAAAVLLLSSAAVLYVAFGKFGIGNFLSDLTEKICDVCFVLPIAKLLKFCRVTPFVSGLITQGIAGGAITVLAFLPRLAILSLFTCVIEESGILARLAFASHGFLSKFGLTGRAVFALMTGFGCTAVAVMSACGLENECVRKRTSLSLSFIPCSAKVPVIVWISSEIGNKGGFLAVLLLWTVGLLSALIFAAVDVAGKKGNKNDLIVEFPPYRVPKIKTLLKALQNFAGSFIIRVGSIITVVTAFLWIFKSVSPDFCFLTEYEIERSILVAVAEKIQFVFYPAGVKNWRFAVAALAGVFAKENVLSVFALLGTGNASVTELFAFGLFFALYPPCVSALAVVFRQEGVKSFLHVVCFHYALAFVAFYSVLKPVYILLLALLFGLAVVRRVCSRKAGRKGVSRYEKIYSKRRKRSDRLSS